MGFGPEKQRVIDSLSPHRRALTSWRYFYKAADSELAEKLKNSQVWDPSCFDGDSSL
jgi:isochorismate hydrolase